MTDTEIIKALEDYIKENEFEYFHSNMMSEYPLIKKSLDLINRQQAEIERLQSMNRAKLDTIHDLQADTNKLKEQLQDVTEKFNCQQTVYTDLSKIIKDQKGEIEKLKNENKILSINADNAFQDGLNEAQDLYAEQVKAEIKSKVVKEFAEKLKKEFLTLEYQVNTTRKTLPIDFVKDQIKWLLQEVSIDIIDSLVEEYEKGR